MVIVRDFKKKLKLNRTFFMGKEIGFQGRKNFFGSLNCW